MAEPRRRSRKPANRRGAARFGAVQALYQMDVGGATLPHVLAEFEAHRLGRELEGEQLRPADLDYFRGLVTSVVEMQRTIDPIIHATLPPTWPLKRIDTLLRAILRCGVAELLGPADVPARVVIKEYVEIADAFFSADEPGLVNGVLDHVARDLRPGEFAAAASA
jgi:N utilization substance protein B